MTRRGRESCALVGIGVSPRLSERGRQQVVRKAPGSDPPGLMVRFLGRDDGYPLAAFSRLATSSQLMTFHHAAI